MATAQIPIHHYAVRGLPTKSVTLYPTKAQIVRTINGISLRPGPNQVVIEGLTPTVDAQSIKVDGTGSATITDLNVQMVDNREVYEDIYEEEDDDDDDEEEESDDDEENETPDLKKVKEQIEELNNKIAAEREVVNSATSRLEFLQKYGNSIEDDRPENVGDFLSKYEKERSRVFDAHTAASNSIKKFEVELAELLKTKIRLEKEIAKAKRKELKEKAKAQEKKERKKREKAQERARIRAERIKFWPKKVYKIIISLDASSGMTPASSRRGSMESLVSLPAKVTQEPDAKSATTDYGEVNIAISYITYSAGWSPHYDLSLSTVTNTGVLDFSAELNNTTSETWSDAKVTLSTSQTSYQGLGDTIPLLHPWHVRLAKGSGGENGALFSNYEKQQKAKIRTDISVQMHPPRHQLFGLPSGGAGQELQIQVSNASQSESIFSSSSSLFGPPAPAKANASLFQQMPQRPPHVAQQMQQQQQQQQQIHMQRQTASFGAAAYGGGQTWDSVAIPPPLPAPAASMPRATMAMRMAPTGHAKRRSGRASAEPDLMLEEEGGADSFIGDESTITEADPTLLFEESSFEESGLTTTYDVPSLKTLAPMSSSTKHKVVRVEFKNVIFSHIIIPKLRTAAFLKARLQNTSKITLLKGTAGLTLDGSFLGQSAIPRCSAGDSFSLPLGVDPTISVHYTKPTVRRSQSGIFSKEDCEVFNRTASITNSKNAPVELLILDQVPISEDERLRIETVTPRGLRIGGEAVSAGSAATGENTTVGGAGGSVAKWGTATVSMKKGGEVNWKVRLLPQRGCKLVLEYEATYPGGENVIPA